jgi:hypothetical protein
MPATRQGAAMTISTTTNQISYTGDGVSLDFSFPYPFITPNDLKVFIDGVQEFTGFTVTGTVPFGGSGTYSTGTVSFAVAPASLATVLIYCDPDLLQGTGLPPNDPFPSKTVEKMVDKVTLQIQAIYRKFGNAITFPVGDTANGVLPDAATRASKVLSFDVFGNAVVVAAAAGSAISVLTALADPTSAVAGPSLVAHSASQAYASGTVGAKLRELISVKDYPFLALGDGVADDTAAFVAAGAATTGPVFVPYSANFYALTALSTALRNRLYGPGEVRVAGTATGINSISNDGSTSKPNLSIQLHAHAPAASFSGGSVGRGAIYAYTNRTGGIGEYGAGLFETLVSATPGSGEFDVAFTAWLTATSMNNAGSAAYGMWAGANTPWRTQTYTGGAVVGMEINVGQRHSYTAMQADIGGTKYTVGLQIVPDVIPTVDTQHDTVTMTVGVPGTVNHTAHGLTADTPVYFGGTGTLPAAVVAGTTYYVLAAGLAANTYRISGTRGGAAITFALSSVGQITCIPSFPVSFLQVMGPSIHDHRAHIGYMHRYDTCEAGGLAFQIAGGGSASYNVPAAYTRLLGFWVDGIDMTGASLSGVPFAFNAGSTAATATAGGGIALPGTVLGFVKARVGATNVRIPYYAV